MSFKNEPIPAAAAAAGMTNLVFADDFDTPDTIDFSGEGKPGYNWYTDRPYSLITLTKDELQVRDSVLYMKPIQCGSAIGMPTYSKKGKTGFTMHYGYAEARIRAKQPEGEYNGVPAFWGIGLKDFLGQPWEHCGELDILEIIIPHTDANRKIYTGTLHDHHKRAEGKRIASNLINATGYQDKFDFIDEDWHTYAALWEPGHIAWYMDGKLMHSARYNATDLPQYYYRDDPTPLPRIENLIPEKFDSRTWEGAHCIMEEENEVLFLGCNYHWPMEVDWVRVWQK